MIELGDECDIATNIARLYSLRVIMNILGLPEDDQPLMLRLTQNLLSSDDPDFREGETPAQSINTGVAKFAEYFDRTTADRRAHPVGDLASLIANAVIDGHPLDDFQTFVYYISIATAGHDAILTRSQEGYGRSSRTRST
jgi:cytochrome P450